MNSQRETYGSGLAAIGGYAILGDLLDTGNNWVAGVIFLIVAAVLLLLPEGKR